MDTNPVLHWTDHAGERQAWPLTKLQEEFKAFLAWRAQQPALGAFFRQELAKMDSEDPGLAPLNGMMLDLRHAALKYLAQGSRVAETVIAVLDASAEHLPAASGEPVAWVRVIDEALVCSHLDVADQADDYDTAKRKLNNLLAHEQSIGAYFAAQPAPALVPLTDWAVSRWNDEVKFRPLVNKHRRTLDDTWRQVIRFAGGDPDALIGPAHDVLFAGTPAKEAP